MAAVPPLWHMVMNRKIIEWDERFASEEEKELAAQANLKSGQNELIEAAEKYLLKAAA
jgi:alkane 1-monooxygenase